MYFLLRVTFFVAFSLFLALPAWGQSAASPVKFEFRMAGEAIPAPDQEPQVALGSVLDYRFYQSYSIGVEFAYYRPFNQFDDQAFDGFDDVGLYLMDSKLWSNKWYDITLQFKATAILPTSQPSQQATMMYGGSESLILRKGFGGRMSVSYVFAATETQFRYATTIDKQNEIYNTPFNFMNKLIGNYDIFRDFHFQTFGEIKTYYDYVDSRYNIFALGLGFVYDWDKNSSIDFGVRTYVKEAGANDPWNGPPTSAALFGAEGTIFYIGTTLKI